jgi:hypothetical protein
MEEKMEKHLHDMDIISGRFGPEHLTWTKKRCMWFRACMVSGKIIKPGQMAWRGDAAFFDRTLSYNWVSRWMTNESLVIEKLKNVKLKINDNSR